MEKLYIVAETCAIAAVLLVGFVEPCAVAAAGASRTPRKFDAAIQFRTNDLE